MKQIFYSITSALLILLISCGTNNNSSAENKANATASQSNTATDHADHDHSSGDSSSCGSDHNHESEDHSTHDHSSEDGHNHDHSSENGHNHGASGSCGDEPEITMSETQAKSLGLTYTKVAPQTFRGAIKVSGTIEAAAEDISSIVSPVSGLVEFAGKPLYTGQAVSKGQRLIVINSSTLGADNQAELIANARTELRRAETELRRIESLLADQITTQGEYQQALAEKEIAANRLESLTRNTSNDGSRIITSPINGYITNINITKGEYVEQGAPLLTISSLAELTAIAYIPQKYAKIINQADVMNLTTPASDNIYTTSRVLSRGRTSNGGMVELRFAVPNSDGLMPGMMIEGYVLTQPRSEVIAIPLTAITDEQGAKYAYIRVAKDGYEKRNITLGQSNGKLIEITSGLKAGDNIVATGPYFVKLAGASASIPHGHSH